MAKPVCKHPPIYSHAEIEALCAVARRTFIGEPVFNINAIDPECPYGRDPDFSADVEREDDGA